MICLHKFLLQDPAEADKLLKIQRDLDETKIILVSAEIVQDFTCNAFCGLPITLLVFPCAFAPYFDFLQDKFYPSSNSYIPWPVQYLERKKKLSLWSIKKLCDWVCMTIPLKWIYTCWIYVGYCMLIFVTLHIA